MISLLYHTALNKQAKKGPSSTRTTKPTKNLFYNLGQRRNLPETDKMQVRISSILGVLGNCWGGGELSEVLKVNVSQSEKLTFIIHKVVYEFMSSLDITQNEVYLISDVRILVHLSEILEKCSVILY